MKKNTIMKVSAILASAIMAVSANVTMASANEVNIESIELSNTQAVAGKTASVTMSMETNDTCMGYDLLVEYDPELTLERVIGANAYDSFDNCVALVGYTADTFKDEKPVVTLQFSVPENAEIGKTYEVKFSDVRVFSGVDYDFENYETYDGTIEILEETKRCTDYMIFEKYDEATGNLFEQKPGLRGDVDGDGKVSVRDAAKIARHCANRYSGVEIIDNEEGQFFGNVNEDNMLAVNDAAAISRYVSRNSVGNISWDEIIK